MNRLKVPIPESIRKIGLNDIIFSIGSCFSQEVADQLGKIGLDVLSNPFGTVYNVASIAETFRRLADPAPYLDEEFFIYRGKYACLDHSTAFDDHVLNKALLKTNDCLARSAKQFRKSTVVIVTPGTSVVYRYQKTGKIAANCHKIPQDQFERTLLTVEETIGYLNQIVSMIRLSNPDSLIIFSLSPVRHTPVDPVENQFSKSILRTAIGNVVQSKDVYYFPSYEIVMDELRDYQYYEKDGVHMSKKAVKIIINRLEKNLMDESLKDYLKQFKTLSKAFHHKPSNPESSVYRDFLFQYLEKSWELFTESDNNATLNLIAGWSMKIRLYHPDLLDALKDKNAQLNEFLIRIDVPEISERLNRKNRLMIRYFQTIHRLKEAGDNIDLSWILEGF